MIITRVPFRVSFFGGGTDIPVWFERFGGSVLSTTIDKYCYVTARPLPPFFDHKVRLDILLRVAALNTVQPSALKELNEILEKQFAGNSNTSRAAMGGVKRTADIMNFLESSTESQLIEAIREMDEDLSSRIEDLMFVFDNLAEVDDRGIQALLREVSSEVLIVALKGADDAIKDKIFRNMSKRASELLQDDLEAKGPVRISEVEAAQKEILTIARRMADAGEIVLGGKGGEEMI